jgi:hypothetical protein
LVSWSREIFHGASTQFDNRRTTVIKDQESWLEWIGKWFRRCSIAAREFQGHWESRRKIRTSIVLNGDGGQTSAGRCVCSFASFKRPTPWVNFDELGELRKHAAPEIRGG